MTCWTENLPTMPGIYKLTNILNGKIYIGKAQNLKYRTNTYKKRNNPQRAIEFAMNKYGREGFRIEAIEIFPRGTSDNVLCKRETFWISFLRTSHPKRGYNSTEVSFDERGEKFRKRKLEIKTLKRQNKWVAPEKIIKEKNSVCLKHWGMSKPVNQLDKITGELIKTWNSASEASIALCGCDSSRSTIGAVANGRYGRKTSLGFKWQYSDRKKLPSELPEELKNRRKERMKKINSSKELREKCVASRKANYTKEMAIRDGLKRRGVRRKFALIYQICPETNRIIQKWHGATDAAAQLFWDINMREKIYQCLKGRKNSAYGFIWKRERDYV